jgi:hypothetical protein
MLLIMGVRKGLKKLKEKKAQENEPSQPSASKRLHGAGTREVARRSTESVDEEGTRKEAKKG